MTAVATPLWMKDSRSRRIAELLALLWMLSFVDLGFTLWAQENTPFDEQNPIAHTLLDHHHPILVVLMKITLTAVGATIFWRARMDRRVEIVLWGLGLMYMLVTLRWSQYISEVAAINRWS